jgi:hypothetical protein
MPSLATSLRRRRLRDGSGLPPFRSGERAMAYRIYFFDSVVTSPEGVGAGLGDFAEPPDEPGEVPQLHRLPIGVFRRRGDGVFIVSAIKVNSAGDMSRISPT